MACMKGLSLALTLQISDPELQPDHPTASGGLQGYSADGLEQLQQVATEIIEGTAVAEQSVHEEEEKVEQAEDGDDKNEAT